MRGLYETNETNEANATTHDATRDATRDASFGARSAARCKLAACALLCVTVLVAGACDQAQLEQSARAATGGEPAKGKVAITRYGCATCHTIPGIKGADALVGPSLEHVASRSYVAGVLPNTPPNVMRWIQNPPGVDHLTAMPNLGVTDSDARDIASYLYTLK
jgi:cytochrome c